MKARILLIVGGGIAAYKCLEFVRRARERGHAVRCVMTAGAERFVTPLSFSAIAGHKALTDLFSTDDESEIGHIGLARGADLIVVAPATADLLAKMANGLADDLATAILLATDKPVLVAPAMNPRMWSHPATRRNADTLSGDGIAFVGPESGEMAEGGEAGLGRMAEPAAILAAAEAMLAGGADGAARPLAGRRVVVTSGPTHEPIDPVRYLANRSSGRQGHAVAAAAARAGAAVTLVSGPVALPNPPGVTTIRVETAREMLAVVRKALPADVGVFAAAVADWRAADAAGQKLKKSATAGSPALNLVENPDILATIAADAASRPALVVGFAAETDRLIDHATAKLKSKGADVVVANDVSAGTGVMGGERNRVHLVTRDGTEEWDEMAKEKVAEKLVAWIADRLDAGSA